MRRRKDSDWLRVGFVAIGRMERSNEALDKDGTSGPVG